jgi:hypothetical protein
LEKYINDLAILIHCSPQIVLLAVDLDENFIDVERIAVTPLFALKASGINGPEIDASEPDRFPSDDDATFGQEIFNISMT